MESIIVEGGRPLEGKVSISGAKNQCAAPAGGCHIVPGRLFVT